MRCRTMMVVAAAALSLAACGKSDGGSGDTLTLNRSTATADTAAPGGRPSDSAAAPASTAATGATLPDGEYACYGSGGTVMAGLGFKVSGGSYTDLDGSNAGTVAVNGTDVVFTGGHMSEIGGGRDYNGKSFRVGSQASCEKW